MIGPLELLLVAMTAAVGGIAWTVGIILLRRGGRARARERAPVPWIPTILSMLAIPAAIPAGLALGGVLVEGVVLAARFHGTPLMVSGPADSFAAYPSGVGLAIVWFLLPGLLAAGSLLASRARSWKRAALLAAAGWGGFGIGLVVGMAVVVPMALGLADQGFPGAGVSLVDLVSSTLGGAAAFGVAGACAPVVWVLAGGSPGGLRTTALSSVWMPSGALLVAGLTTPPDPLTQLVAAGLIGTAWLTGLGAGALTTMLRRPRGE